MRWLFSDGFFQDSTADSAIRDLSELKNSSGVNLAVFVMLTDKNSHFPERKGLKGRNVSEILTRRKSSDHRSSVFNLMFWLAAR